jgi:hypothetical protein
VSDDDYLILQGNPRLLSSQDICLGRTGPAAISSAADRFTEPTLTSGPWHAEDTVLIVFSFLVFFHFSEEKGLQTVKICLERSEKMSGKPGKQAVFVISSERS